MTTTLSHQTPKLLPQQHHLQQQPAYNLMKQLFTDSQATPDQLQLKRASLNKLHEVFPLINETNLKEFITYLQEWITYEIDPVYTRLLVSKIRELLQYFTLVQRQIYCQKIFTLIYALMPSDDPSTRRWATQLCIQMLGSAYGGSFLKNIVKTLIKDKSLYYGYESSLTIVGKFSDRYDKSQLMQIFNHENLYISYPAKKVTLNSIINFCSQSQLTSQLVEILYLAVRDHLLKDQEELIQTGAIKAKILLLAKASKIGMIGLAVDPYQEVSEHYQSALIRTKYILLQCTPVLISMYKLPQINLHAEFIYRLMSQDEPQISELAIKSLKYFFVHLDFPTRQHILQHIIEITKDDHRLQETVAQNLLDLLFQQSQQFVIACLNSFLANVARDKDKDKKQKQKQKQRDSVKVLLFKTFSKHPNANKLYQNYKQIFDDILSNKSWRVRLQSIQILESMLNLFPFNSYFLQIVRKLIFDSASRIRLQAIHLVITLLSNQNNKKICQQLIPKIVQEIANPSYLQRLTVLFFIDKSLQCLSKTKFLTKDLIVQFERIVWTLCQDRVQNVRDVALKLKETREKQFSSV